MDAGNAAQQRAQSSLIRAEQVLRLPHLTPEQKAHTKARVEKLWDYINNNQQSDPNVQKAQAQLTQLSNQLMLGMQQYKRAKSGVGQTGQMPAQATQGNQQQQQPMQNQQMQLQNQPNNAAQPQNSAQSFAGLQAEVQARVNQQKFFYPPAMTEGSKPAETWLLEAKARYGQAIQRAQMAKTKKTELQKAAQLRAQDGQPLTPDEQAGLMAKLAQCDKAIKESQNFMEKFKEQQEQFRNARPQQQFSQPELRSVDSGPNEGSSGSQMQQNAPGPQAHSIATAQAAARANAASANVQNTSQSGSTPLSAGPQQTPIDQAQAGFNAQSNMMMQTPQSRPNTAGGQGSQSAIQASTGGNASASHAHPTSAVNTHQLNAVNGMKAHVPPIAKNLVVSEPTPVNMPPTRPTLNGGANVGMPGQLAQPALTQFPGYVLEQSEDGHLLSKKKLQELVREIIGPNAEDQLSPEAEELCLSVLDDFVEEVITDGCKMAKLRGGTSLEARDCMVILERHYNMRIPGFSTDEVRTVRKVQPAQGWLNKLTAVQTAKLMNAPGGSAVGGAVAGGSGAANGGS